MKVPGYQDITGLFGTPHTRKEIRLDGFHHAGVLVPLVHTISGYSLLFTKRTDTVETHKGQISFPGGMRDQGDNDIVTTALREAEEELGLPSNSVEVHGMLDDFPTPSQFVITPVVGTIASLPELTPNPHEVAEVFEIPLGFFAEESSGRYEMREFRGEVHEVWYYNHGPHEIWGATARIIRSLLHRLKMI